MSNNYNRSYGRMKARKLGEVRQNLLQEILPQVAVNPETNWRELQTQYNAIWLEIGFGTGAHLVNMARQNEEVLCLGAEPFSNGIAACLKAMLADNLSNIRIFPNDVRTLLASLPDGYLSRVDILFPDPWPKRAHHKRRLINAALLQELSRVMSVGAELNIASDHPDYQAWILEHMLQSPHFKWDNAHPNECFEQPLGFVKTRYQNKAAEYGNVPIYLRYIAR
jgi:tRNA (guanine-N7-)-methyltransferase